MAIRLHIGDVIELKKCHPCGHNEWEVWRLGMDIGLRCLGCDRKVRIPREKLERRVKRILREGYSR